MMRKVRVHDDDEVTRAEVQSVNVGGSTFIKSFSFSTSVNHAHRRYSSPETELSSTRFQKLMSGDELHIFECRRCATHDFVFSVHLCQLFRHVLRAVRTCVIHHDDLPRKMTSEVSDTWAKQTRLCYSLFFKRLR